MIVDIRGTSGSGKSHIVHSLIREVGSTQVSKLDGKIVGTHIGERIVALGSYEKVCGGCDALPTQDLIQGMVDHFAGQYPVVILEGLLVSHTFERWNNLAKKHDDYRFLFLSTSLEECIARVRRRRLAKGNDKPYNPEHLIKDWHQARRVEERLRTAGRQTQWITGYSEVKEMLCEFM